MINSTDDQNSAFRKTGSESSTVILGEGKQETKTIIPRFRDTQYLLSLALLFVPSKRLLLARENDHPPVTRAKTVRGNRHYVIGWGFSLEIIMRLPLLWPATLRKRNYRGELEDTNKYGSSFNRWGWLVDYYIQPSRSQFSGTVKAL